MAVTTETLHQPQAEPIEEEPEPEQLAEILLPVERLVFDPREKFDEYKRYLASLVGESAIISACVTHRVAELTGLLVTRSEATHVRSVNGEILGVAGSYVTFQCRSDEAEPAIYTTHAAFVRIESEEEED